MRLNILGVTLLGVSLATSAGAADVRVTMADGKVSISAKDATAGQILSEWARVGQTHIVNAERLPSTPMTIELNNVSEAQALDTLLRTASGYLAAPRAVAVANASAYDRIFVLASSTGTAARPVTTAAQPPAAFQPPVFQMPVEDPQDREPVEAIRPVPVRPGAANGAPPTGAGGPMSQPPIRPVPNEEPPTQPMPTTFGAAPGPGPIGVATPGMIVPTPQQQQPGQVRPTTP